MARTFKLSVNENLFWKETSKEWRLLYFSEKKKSLAISLRYHCSVNVNNSFLPTTEARTYICEPLGHGPGRG